MYIAFKHSHMLFAFLSIFLFTLRGMWMLRRSPMLEKKWVRILPHIIDTLLLVTASGLIVQLGVYPFQSGAGWLTAKLLGLIAYIVLGTVALKRGKTYASRVIALFACWLILAYIVSVALSKSPLPWS